MSIIPLINRQKNTFPAEARTKYFITQSIASSIILLSLIASININSHFYINAQPLILILNSALLIKLGAAPFHFWFPEVIKGLRWNNNIIILTWQKIAPIILLSYNIKIRIFISSIVIISSLIRGLARINQIRLRRIIAYSSINHISWMIRALIISYSNWILYFRIYSAININIVYIFKKLNIYKIRQINILNNKNKIIKISITLNFLSLGGLPPFLGFIPKWITINNILLNNIFILRTILVISSLLTLYIYIRIIFSSITINSSEFLTTLNIKLSFNHGLLNIIILTRLIRCTLIIIII